MSFSAEVKAELSELCGTARHCQIAELTAIITLCGRIQITEDDDYRLWIHTENISVAKKFFLLLKQTFSDRGFRPQRRRAEFYVYGTGQGSNTGEKGAAGC